MADDSDGAGPLPNGGCFAVWEPLLTGVDAESIAEILGASFACVLWLDQDKNEARNTYPRGLLHFVDEAAKERAVAKVREAFPRTCNHGDGPLVYRPVHIRTVSRDEWMATLDMQNQRNTRERIDQDPGPGWSSSTNIKIAPLLQDVWLDVDPLDRMRKVQDVDYPIILGDVSSIASCRPIGEVGLPRHHATGKWSFRVLRHRLAMLLQPSEFWRVFNERFELIRPGDPPTISYAPFSGESSPNWRSLWDCVYILEEAVRRGFNTDAGFLDVCQKVEHMVRKGTALTRDLDADSPIVGESDAERLDELEDPDEAGAWLTVAEAWSKCGVKLRRNNLLRPRGLAEVLAQDDYRLAQRLHALKEGLPGLSKVPAAEAFPLQLQSYLQGAPDILRGFLEEAEPAIQRAIMERGRPVRAGVQHLDAVRDLLRRGAYSASALTNVSVGALQQAFATLNNAELRVYYQGESKRLLRDLASKYGIKLTVEERASNDAIRQRLADVDRRWVKDRPLHLLDVSLRSLDSREDVADIIHERLGCMSRRGAKRHLQVIGSNYDGPVYQEASPGRGTPRIRFRQKRKGLVPNKKMAQLLDLAKSKYNSLLYAWEDDEVVAARRLKVLAELQQKWRPLEPDDSRLILLLITCTQKKGHLNIPENLAFADLLRKEQLYRRVQRDAIEGASKLCRSLGLCVNTRRRCADYVESVRRYEAGRAEALEHIQEMRMPRCQPLIWRKTDNATASLQNMYARMDKNALLLHCTRRQLTGIDPDSCAEDLRAKLRRLDVAFDEHFPEDEALEDLPTKRLRALAPLLGVRQGDQVHSTLVHNLGCFAQHRYTLSTGGPATTGLI